MKKYLFIFFISMADICNGQELFVSTEPASNMAKGSIGIRLNAKLFKMNYNGKFASYRIEPEIMVGISKKTMIHIATYGSTMFQQNFRWEGASIYGKYRLFSSDEVHEHFRMAAYAKVAFIKNPQILITKQQSIVPYENGGFAVVENVQYNQSNDVDPDGNNSSVAAGIIATKLKNRFALSASSGYAYRLNNIAYKTESAQPLHAINYTASAGYLLFPREYTSYKQTNLNVYVEVLGQSFADKKQGYFDVAPAVQFIFNSIARFDISYRTQLAGNIKRLSNNNFMVRLEYNLLNIF